jgi:Protein of unknown function (DUF1353)
MKTLKLEEVRPGRTWRLLEDLEYEVTLDGENYKIIVPAGYQTDGTSIPPALRIFLAVWGSYGRAAIMHDFLYERLRTVGSFMTRREIDLAFYNLMRSCGTRRLLALLLWSAVRLFGARYAR